MNLAFAGTSNVGCPSFPRARAGQPTGPVKRPRNISLATLRGAPSKCDRSVACCYPRCKTFRCPPSNRIDSMSSVGSQVSRPSGLGCEQSGTRHARSIRNREICSPVRSIVVGGLEQRVRSLSSHTQGTEVLLDQQRVRADAPRAGRVWLPRLPCKCAASFVSSGAIPAIEGRMFMIGGQLFGHQAGTQQDVSPRPMIPNNCAF
jgi:hypothetical protein